MIDVPMSGGQSGAEEQRLAYMAGGEARVLEKCRPVFVTSASHIFHLGELGMGATAKMLIQIVVCLNMIAAHESELLCDKTGLDFKSFQDVLHVSSGQSNVLDTWQRFKDQKNLKPFEGSAPRSSPRVCRPRWNWRVRSAHPCPARRSPKGSSNAYWRLIKRHSTAGNDFAHKGRTRTKNWPPCLIFTGAVV